MQVERVERYLEALRGPLGYAIMGAHIRAEYAPPRHTAARAHSPARPLSLSPSLSPSPSSPLSLLPPCLPLSLVLR